MFLKILLIEILIEFGGSLPLRLGPVLVEPALVLVTDPLADGIKLV